MLIGLYFEDLPDTWNVGSEYRFRNLEKKANSIEFVTFCRKYGLKSMVFAQTEFFKSRMEGTLLPFFRGNFQIRLIKQGNKVILESNTRLIV